MSPFVPLDYLQLALPSHPRLSPDATLLAYVSKRVIDGCVKSQIELIGASRQCVVIDGVQPVWSPDGQHLLFTGRCAQGSGLHIFEPSTGKIRSLTVAAVDPETPAWSPCGRWIAFVAHTPNPVPARVVPNQLAGLPLPPDPIVTERLHFKEERRGHYKDGRRRLYVISVDGGAARSLTPPSCEIGANEGGGLSRLDNGPQWSANSRQIFIAGNLRPDDKTTFASGILACSVEDGALDELVNGDDWFVRSIVLGGEGQIAFTGYQQDQTMRFRQDRLFVFHPGELPQLLPTPPEGRPENLLWSAALGRYLFLSEAGGRRRLFSIDPDGRETRALFDEPGQLLANVSLAATGDAVALLETADRPAVIVRLEPQRTTLPTVLADLNTAWVGARHKLNVEKIGATSSDGREVEGFLTRPYGEASPAPLLMYLHGGPMQMDSPAFELRRAAWVGAGYAVLRVNYRGSTGYGEEFMQQGWRHPTTLMYDDCIAVLEAAVACGGIDPDRLFVGGVSAGAMMTAGLVSYCDHFRAAFAQMGLYDLRSYVGTVDEGAVAWDQLGGANYWATMDLGAHSPLAEAHYIKTPILLIAGQADMRTPASQTEELYRAIKLAGTTPSRLVLFPELGHGVGTSALTYLELMAHPMAWFDEHDSHK